MFDLIFPQITIGEGFLRQADRDSFDLLKLTGALSDARIPLETAVKEVIIPAIEHNFHVGGNPPWQTLSPITAEIRKRAGFNPYHPILIRTGHLFDSARDYGLWRITKNTAFFDSNAFTRLVPYAGFHMTGTSNMPARPFMNLEPRDADEIQAVFALWMQHLVDKYWGLSTGPD